MSYAINPYAVRLDEVRRVMGSGDAGLVARIVEGSAAFLSQFSKLDDEDDDEPTVADAVRQMVFGEPYRSEYGSKYGYAFELLCGELGEALPNNAFSSMRWSWIDAVDEGLASSGVPESTLGMTRHLVCRRLPIDIPEPDDFPSIGHLNLAEIGQALDVLRAADRSALDPEVADAIEEVSGWLEACVDRGCDLVCFYS